MSVSNMMKISILLGRPKMDRQSHFGLVGISKKNTLWPFGHVTMIQIFLYGLQGHDFTTGPKVISNL